MRAVRGVGLTLEPQRQGHAPAMFELLADPAIYRFENTPPPSLAALRRRYARLERRQSPDGRQTWLNWVVRLPDGRLAGFVQATIDPAGAATIAYVLSSDH